MHHFEDPTQSRHSEYSHFDAEWLNQRHNKAGHLSRFRFFPRPKTGTNLPNSCYQTNLPLCLELTELNA